MMQIENSARPATNRIGIPHPTIPTNTSTLNSNLAQVTAITTNHNSVEEPKDTQNSSRSSLLRRGNAALATLWAVTSGLNIAAALMNLSKGNPAGYLNLITAGLCLGLVYIHAKNEGNKRR